MPRPLPEKKPLILRVDGQDNSGAGIVHAFGKKILVAGAIAGEKIALHIRDPRATFPEATIERVVDPAPHRVEPPCPVFGKCGGCTLQMLSYEEQLHYKRRRLKEALRYALEDQRFILRKTIGMADPWRYRNKVQYAVGANGKYPVIGFYAPVSYRIVTNRGCLIQHPEADLLKEVLLDHMRKHAIEPYDHRNGEGLVRTLMTRKGYATGAVLCILVLNGDTLPAAADFIERARAAVPALTGIVVNDNPKDTRVILSRDNHTLWGDPLLTDRLLGLEFSLSPNSFYQINHAQTEALYTTALDMAAITNADTVLDLYSGAGTITLPAARKAKKAWGLELSREAVADARRNAAHNGIANVEFIAGNVDETVSRLLARPVRPDIVLLDPPRAGCDKKLLWTLAAARPRRMVYISCDPTTLARDLAVLEPAGYRTTDVAPVDLFPHTGHVEAIALLLPAVSADRSRKKK